MRWRAVLALAVVVAAAAFGSLIWMAGARTDASRADATRADVSRPDRQAVGTSGLKARGDIEALRARDLVVPIEGANPSSWKGAFYQSRGDHRHEAVDLMAPRNTPIHAADDGVVAKLFLSKAGGLTIYERDPSDRYIYYYAHLERYADIHEGGRVSRGQVIGYVGTSGDAPKDTPHLHFAIMRLSDPKRWWEATALDPYEAYGK